jgi:hypothetical protein
MAVLSKEQIKQAVEEGNVDKLVNEVNRLSGLAVKAEEKYTADVARLEAEKNFEVKLASAVGLSDTQKETIRNMVDVTKAGDIDLSVFIPAVTEPAPEAKVEPTTDDTLKDKGVNDELEALKAQIASLTESQSKGALNPENLSGLGEGEPASTPVVEEMTATSLAADLRNYMK